MLHYYFFFIKVCFVPLFCFTTVPVALYANYTITIDLIHTDADKITVTVESPELKQNYAIYRIPAGTSEGQSNLTDWIEELAVYDSNGKYLKYELIDNSAILIYEVSQTIRLTYKVVANHVNNSNKAVLSHIQPENNFFLLNRNGFFGYFEGYEDEQAVLNILKPKDLYGATNLKRIPDNPSDTLDVFIKPQKDLLHENLILYARPDTFSFHYAGVRFKIAVYSEKKAIISRDLYYILKPVVAAVNRFLTMDNRLDTVKTGLPVSEYTFLFYFTEKSNITELNLSEYGGLMCSATSSFYALPEITYSPNLYRLVQRMVSHELMHLFLPHLLHTDRSARAVNGAELTRHLWLYEGVTEYFALLLLLQNELITEEDFWEEISKKIEAADLFPAMSMTEVSENLHKKNKFRYWYPNFYHQGALVALFLDLELAALSNNKQSLRQLLLKMSKQEESVFNDLTLLDTLVDLSYPQIKQFVNSYITGKQILPLTEGFEKIGVRYFPSITEPFTTFGQFWVVPDYKAKKMKFIRISNDRFGLHEGDYLISLNDIPISISNFSAHKHLIYRPPIGVPLNLVVKRKRTEQIHTFSTNPWVTSKTSKFAIRQNPDLNEEQKSRRQWLLYEKTIR